MSRQSIVFTGKEHVELIEEPIGVPAPHELLIQTTRTLVSTGTELICFTRNFSAGTHWDGWVKYPFPVGYLNAGRVVKAGAEAADFHPGDRVASRGPHSSRFLLPATMALRIPENASDDEACWMGLGKIAQVAIRAAEHRLGDSVAVIGLGLLGQLVVQYAQLMGASAIVAIDTATRRLEMAQAHGATHTLCMTAAKARNAVRKITSGCGADVVYDITGHPAVLASALPLAARFGKVLLLGDTGHPAEQHLTPDVVLRGVRIIGAHDGHPPAQSCDDNVWSAHGIEQLFLQYLSRRQIRVDDLITHRFKPDQASEMYAMLRDDRSGAMGVIIEWQP